MITNKNKEWEKHDYVAKVKITDKYIRYFYDKAEYDTYIKNRSDKQLTELSNVGKNILNKMMSGNIVNNGTDNKSDDEATSKVDGIILANKISNYLNPYELSMKIVDLIKYYDNDSKSNDINTSNNNPVNRKGDGSSYSKGEYDNKFTKDEILNNMNQSELSENTSVEPDEYYDYVEEIVKTKNNGFYPPNAELDDVFQREGLIDERVNGYHPETFNDLKLLDSDMNDDDDMKTINSDNLNMYGDNDVNGDGYPDTYYNYGYVTNCAYCTLAYEMRQRGYDVEASSASLYTNNTTDVIESWYEGGKFYSSSSSANIEKIILQNSDDGSRGQFCVTWSNDNGGHSMIYEVKKSKIQIRDCQTNKKYTYKEFISLYGEYIDKYYYMRTDNLELTDLSLVGVKNKDKR